MKIKMKLIFTGSGQTATLDIDRENKILIVTSSKTNNIPIKTEWKNLFDKGKEEEQEKITDTLSDDLFIKAIETSMNLNGYKLLYPKC